MRPTPEIALALITVLEMVHRAVDAAHGAALAAHPQFAILTRLARRKSSPGVGHIELIAMMRRITSPVVAITLAFALPYSAYAGAKLTLSYITKWEVIGYWKVVGYVGEQPFVFVNFRSYCPALKVGGNFVLRTFSPSIQGGDTVIVNGTSCAVADVEAIRQN